MIKYFLVSFFCIISVLPSDLFSQSDWKSGYPTAITELDSMFARERRHFRLMQTYQNEATEELILKDMDTLRVFVVDVNMHIELCNNYKFSSEQDALNAAESMRLKIEVLKEYLEQCRLQIHVNNKIMQRKLKNESLDFKVSQIDDYKIIDYVPNITKQ